MEKNDFSAIRSGTYGPEHAAAHPDGGSVWLRPAGVGDIPFVHSLTVSDISAETAPEEVIRAVHARNPDALWLIERQRGGEPPAPIGYFGFLPLTDPGLDALKEGALDRKSPPLELVAEGGTRPAAVYVWGVVAHRLVRVTAPLLTLALSPYIDVPFYTVSQTEEGLRSARRRGFVPVDARIGDRGGLVLLPLGSLLAPPPSKVAQLDVIVASNAEHLMMCAYVRGVVFGAEQLAPYREEFDGNDFCGIQLLGFVNNEPAAVLRIRHFASFAKFERYAVLERFRKTRIKYEILEFGIELCRRKGYTKLYAHSQVRLVRFYERFGFRLCAAQRPLVFADHEYVEIEADLAPHPEAITTATDPYVIIRPEGAWDRRGVLDQSAARPATNPV
ncbi:MAG: GNAT family N-acetyltransferase [bacterium]